jgi:hypothetical protein
MEKKRQKRPDEGLGKFCIAVGFVMLSLASFVRRLDFGQRCSAAAAAFMGFSWGLKEVAAAKKWKQKYGEPNLAEQVEMKKRHSISNLAKLLAWLVLSIAAFAVPGIVFVMLFHHRQKMIASNNGGNWFTLLMGIASAIFVFWQLRKGVAYGSVGSRFERTKKPILFWLTVATFLAFSGFCICIAMSHWR